MPDIIAPGAASGLASQFEPAYRSLYASQRRSDFAGSIQQMLLTILQNKHEEKIRKDERKQSEKEFSAQLEFEREKLKEPYRQEQVKREQYRKDNGAAADEASMYFEKANTAASPAERRAFYAKAASAAARIPEEAQVILPFDGSWLKDTLKELNSADRLESDFNYEKQLIGLRAEKDQALQKLKDMPSPEDMRKQQQDLAEQSSSIAIRDFIYTLRTTPDMSNQDMTEGFMSLIEQNPGIQGTEAFKQFRLTMKDLGVTGEGGGQAGLPDKADREAAQAVLNGLRNMGGETRLGKDDYADNTDYVLGLSAYQDMPSDIKRSLENTNFLVGKTNVPFVAPDVLTPGAGVTNDEEVRQVLAYQTALQDALTQWAATGWKSGNIYDIRRPEVRTRIMNEVSGGESRPGIGYNPSDFEEAVVIPPKTPEEAYSMAGTEYSDEELRTVLSLGPDGEAAIDADYGTGAAALLKRYLMGIFDGRRDTVSTR